MTMRPKIAITADYRPAAKNAPPFSFVQAGYYDCVQKAGGLPFIVPPVDESFIDEYLDLADGFLFVGGADLDPRRDGFMLHPSLKLMDSRREDFDRALMKKVVARRMPLFAIGAGMQLLNVTVGGNLFLHIPEDIPKAIPHRDQSDAEHRHGLVVTPGSLMEKVYGDGEIRVNSYHHMAVDEISADFVVTARCPDSVAEAIESRDPDWFALGTQFHPQAESASALDMRLFEEFLDAVRLSIGLPVMQTALV